MALMAGKVMLDMAATAPAAHIILQDINYQKTQFESTKRFYFTSMIFIYDMYLTEIYSNSSSLCLAQLKIHFQEWGVLHVVAVGLLKN